MSGTGEEKADVKDEHSHPPIDPETVYTATETLRNASKAFEKSLKAHKIAIEKEVSKFVEARKGLEDLVKKLGLDSLDESMNSLEKVEIGGEIIATRMSIWAKSPLIQTVISAAKKEGGDEIPQLDLDPRVMRDIIEYLRWDDAKCLESITPTILGKYFGYLGLQHPNGKIFHPQGSIRVTKDERKYLESWFKVGDLLYKGSRDGFSAANFHSKCDNKGPTLTLVSVGEGLKTGFIFGGFNSYLWNSSDGSYYAAPQSLLFSLRRNTKGTKPHLIKLRRYNNNHIYCHSGYGPIFGSGHGLCIASDCNTNASSYSKLTGRHNFEAPPECGLAYFAGSRNFKVSEIEIYQATRLVAHLRMLVHARHRW
mmetsp:Transcript_24628/g.39712  ORF Transcript_24628/g.39712 Transcript_24628/m.39712 type:complete len:367 (-) Transcript_24628:143-1243(-)